MRGISTITLIYRGLAALALVGVAAFLTSCRSGTIPDQGSYPAQLYVSKCGQCHQAYNPSLMTRATWAVQVDAMQERMKQAGLAPLTPDERKTIMEYLSKHAGQQ